MQIPAQHLSHRHFASQYQYLRSKDVSRKFLPWALSHQFHQQADKLLKGERFHATTG